MENGEQKDWKRKERALKRALKVQVKLNEEKCNEIMLLRQRIDSYEREVAELKRLR